MAKYELSDDQVKTITTLIANTTMRVSDALSPQITGILKALKEPIKKEKENGTT